MSSESYHEPIELLSEGTKTLHRAIVSLKEELDAVDWYQQRAEATADEELRAVLLHNKDEEIEHAMMVLEWLRRNDAAFAEHIETYLDSEGPIVTVERRKEQESLQGGAAPPPTPAGNGAHGLGIGSLKGRS